MSVDPEQGPWWRADLDALSFRPAVHRGICMVHRLAFRAFVGTELTRGDCESFFMARRTAFETAARAKIGRNRLAPEENFHLTSRDIATALATQSRQLDRSGTPH